jgi:hypothetical protein
MIQSRISAIPLLLLVGTMLACAGTTDSTVEMEARDEPPTARKITIAETGKMLGSSDVVIIDVRNVGGWINSDSKIKGAVREDPTLVGSWSEKYPKDKTIILYCS